MSIVVAVAVVFGSPLTAIKLTKFHQFFLLKLHCVTDQLRNSICVWWDVCICVSYIYFTCSHTDGVILMGMRYITFSSCNAKQIFIHVSNTNYLLLFCALNGSLRLLLLSCINNRHLEGICKIPMKQQIAVIMLIQWSCISLWHTIFTLFVSHYLLFLLAVIVFDARTIKKGDPQL